MNVSGVQVRRGGIVKSVSNALAVSGLAPECLELEITESFIMGRTENSIDILKQLKKLDVSLSIDDFGTGYSSLNYLKSLPVDRLKIDQSFLSNVPGNANNAAIVRAVIALGHSLELSVVAEGVETRQQQDFLVSVECELVQGFLYSMAVSPQEFVQWLIAYGKAPSR